MKIKGFWKGYVDLCKASMEWLKDYWLLYTIICVAWTVICLLPDMISSYKARKIIKDELDSLADDDWINW